MEEHKKDDDNITSYESVATDIAQVSIEPRRFLGNVYIFASVACAVPFPSLSFVEFPLT
jgi:hypothetical protein